MAAFHPSDQMYEARKRFKHTTFVKKFYLQAVPYYVRSIRYSESLGFFFYQD